MRANIYVKPRRNPKHAKSPNNDVNLHMNNLMIALDPEEWKQLVHAVNTLDAADKLKANETVELSTKGTRK